MNIIWIVIDGIRNYHTNVDYMGKLDIMDNLEKETVYFSNAVTSAPSTVMSVSAMMTSVPAYYIGKDYDNFRYDKSEYTPITDIVKSKGYNVYGVLFCRCLRDMLSGVFGDPLQKYWRNGLKHEEEIWSNDDTNQILFNLLEEGIKEPFFLYVQYNGRKKDNINQQVGEAIKRLKDNGFYKDDIFIMCSDHGMPDPDRGRSKEECYQGSSHDLILSDDNILVPLYIKYPGCIPAKIDKPVSTLDIMPTILDIMKIEKHDDMQGKSLIPLINGDNSGFGNRKLRVDGRFFLQPQKRTALRDEKYKYIICHDNNDEEFYDIRNDKYERNNLINSAKLQSIINEFRECFNKQGRYPSNYDYREGRKWYYPFMVAYRRRKSYMKEPLLLFKDCRDYLMSKIRDDKFMKDLENK